MMERYWSWVIFIVFVVLVGFVLLTQITQFEKLISYQTPAINFPAGINKQKIIEIILVGDMMLDRGVEYMVEKYGGNDFKFPFLKIADYLNEADIVFGNLEGPISDKGIKVGSIYSFRAKPEAMEGLKFAGFNVLSLANNHAFDYGRVALEDCLTKSSNAGISYVGAGFNATESYSAVIKEVDGVKIGFLAYTNLGPETWKASGENSGIAWLGEEDKSSSSPFAAARVNEELLDLVKQQIKKAKEKSDILIVSLHAGEEYQKTPTQSQIDFAKMAIDSGADIVVGHHPHVIQPGEIYPSTSSGQVGYVFYSLGNFIFDQSFSEETMEGEIVEITVENKKIKKVIPKEIKINKFFQPELQP